MASKRRTHAKSSASKWLILRIDFARVTPKTRDEYYLRRERILASADEKTLKNLSLSIQRRGVMEEARTPTLPCVLATLGSKVSTSKTKQNLIKPVTF